MITNRYGINVVKYLLYICEWDKKDILSDIDCSVDSTKGVIEGYTLAIYLMLKRMYRSKSLFEDYIKKTEKAIPYICGVLNISRSIQENTLANGEVYQTYNTLSLCTPVNLGIKFCLDTLVRHKEIKNTDLAKSVHNELHKIFGDIASESITNDRLKYYLNVISSCVEQEAYSCYRPILNLCQLYLEQLYLVDNDLDRLSSSELFELDMPYILQEFLRTSLRHAMLRFNKLSPYEKDFSGKWSMRKRECHLDTSNITMDVLIRFAKNSDFPHVIFDSKTNRSVEGTVKRNRYQIQTYTTEYGAKHSNVVGILQYFVDSSAHTKDLKYNLKRLESDIADLNMFVWVYQLLPNSEPEAFEEYLFSQLIDLYGL